MPARSHDGSWESGLFGELSARTLTLADELEACWQEVANATRTVSDSAAEWTAPGRDVPLGTLQTLFGPAAERLLLCPTRRLSQQRTLQRTLSIIEEHDVARESLVVHVPSVLDTGSEALQESLRNYSSSASVGRWRPSGANVGPCASDRQSAVTFSRCGGSVPKWTISFSRSSLRHTFTC